MGQTCQFLAPIGDFDYCPAITTAQAYKNDLDRLRGYLKNGDKWDERRSTAQDLELALSTGTSKHKIAAVKVEQCSTILVFAKFQDIVGNVNLWRLKHTWFCRNRLCPQCSHMKQIKYLAKFRAALPGIIEQSPNGAFLHLTLTVSNCDVEHLSETIKRMQKAFNSMMKNKRVMGKTKSGGAVVGYAKAIEVTRSQDGTAHPHIHVLLHVRPSYFGKDYIKHEDWLGLWRRYYGDSRISQVHIRRTRDKLAGDTETGRALSGAFEVFKYGLKASDIGIDNQWTVTAYDQLRNVRMLDFGGTIKRAMNDVSDERATQAELQELGQQVFTWHPSIRYYKRQQLH